MIVLYFLKDSDIVDLEGARHLRQLGFDLPTEFYYLDKTLPYVEKGLKRIKPGKRRMNHNAYDKFVYSAPTKEQIKLWLKTLSNNKLKLTLYET